MAIGIRNHIPAFDKTSSLPIFKRLNAAVQAHNWSRNKYISKLRRDGANVKQYRAKGGEWVYKHIAPRNAGIRLEREQTLNALVRCMIYCADFSLESDYLFEVQTSLVQLARMIGQCHEYDASETHRHGRSAYDPVIGALKDLEYAGLVVFAKDFDKKKTQYKASRIFLTPKLFESLGFQRNEMLELMTGLKKYKLKHGQATTNKAYTHTLSKLRNVAEIKRHSLKNLLAKLKREFRGDEATTAAKLAEHEAHKKQIVEHLANTKKTKADEGLPHWMQVEKAINVMYAKLNFGIVQQHQYKIKAQAISGQPAGEAFNEALLTLLQAI